MTIPINGIILNRYKIVEELGRGGFGITYQAEDLDPEDKDLDREERFCAVKQLNISQLPRETVPKAKELFERECEALKALKHPQIPGILAYKAQDNDYYIVQEFIDGWTLDQENELGTVAKSIKEEKSYEPLIKLLIEILEVLSYVHASRIIHRDIKPQNLMRRSNDKKLILIDFGVVKRVDQELNSSRFTAIVSGEYTAPEQKNGQACYASDIYSLGIVALSVLSLLFDRDLTPEELAQLDFPDYKFAEEIKVRLLKMLQSNPQNRYRDAHEALEDFRWFVLNHDTVIAPKPNTHEDKKIPTLIRAVLGIGIIAMFLWLYRCSFFPTLCDPCLSNPSLCTPLPTTKQTETPELVGVDKKGLKASFKIVMLVSDYRWVVESDNKVEEVGTSKKLALSSLTNKLKSSIYSKIANPSQIISVGAASCEGDLSQEETRAALRANKIHIELAAKLFAVKTYRMLNLGQHRLDKCDPNPETTTFQRSVIMIDITQEDKGVDVDQALKEVWVSQARDYIDFDLKDYSLGGDKFKTDICDKEGSCNNPLLK